MQRGIEVSSLRQCMSQPIDDQQGTGILSMVRAHAMYAAGEQPPADAVVPGYDLVSGENGSASSPSTGSWSQQVTACPSFKERRGGIRPAL